LTGEPPGVLQPGGAQMFRKRWLMCVLVLAIFPAGA
jgi:hypothetical protein